MQAWYRVPDRVYQLRAPDSAAATAWHSALQVGAAHLLIRTAHGGGCCLRSALGCKGYASGWAFALGQGNVYGASAAFESAMRLCANSATSWQLMTNTQCAS